MNWFAEQRQEWIGEMLAVYGFINRIHIRRKFGVSYAQAALDFRAFNEANPDAMKYDNRKKIYYAKDAPKALLDNT